MWHVGIYNAAQRSIQIVLRQQQRGETGPFKGSRWSGTSGMVFWRGHCSSISGRLCKDEAYTKHYQWLLPAGDVVEAGREAVCSTLGLTSSLLCWYPIYWYAAELFHCWFLLAEEKEACWSKVVLIMSRYAVIFHEYCVSIVCHHGFIPKHLCRRMQELRRRQLRLGCMGLCVYVYLYVYVCVYVYIYLCICTDIVHVYVYVCVYVYVHVYVCEICMCMRVYVCMYVGR